LRILEEIVSRFGFAMNVDEMMKIVLSGLTHRSADVRDIAISTFASMILVAKKGDAEIFMDTYVEKLRPGMLNRVYEIVRSRT
jgi:hypothetical protein